MARLLTEKGESSSGSEDAGKMADDAKHDAKVEPASVGNFGRSPGQKKLSFKLRGTNQKSGIYRAKKVTLSSNTVAEIASKFNAVLIEDDAEGRAYLKKLNSRPNGYVPSKRISKPIETGSVRAAVQKFEASKGLPISERPKLVLMRKQSSLKKRKAPEEAKETDSNHTANIGKPRLKTKPKKLSEETIQDVEENCTVEKVSEEDILDENDEDEYQIKNQIQLRKTSNQDALKKKEHYRKVVVSSFKLVKPKKNIRGNISGGKNGDSLDSCEENPAKTVENSVESETLTILERTEKLRSSISRSLDLLKPKIQPKPSVDVLDRRKSFPSKDLETVEVPEKKFSLPKDQTTLESALNGNVPSFTNSNNSTSKKVSKEEKTEFKPNSSFLWRSVAGKNISTVSDMKERENEIIAGVKLNVEGKFSTISREEKPRNCPDYMNSTVMNQVKNKENLNKIKEDKENIRSSTSPIYEEFENNRNTKGRTSFLYRNVYITEARNPDVVSVQAKNDSVLILSGFDHCQESSSDYIEPSKCSYGYVDPGSYRNYEDLENNYACINEDINGDEEENIYDDVLNLKAQYEDVYQSVDAGSTIQQDSDSSCDQSNSLYGVAGRPSSQASSSSVSYHVTGQPKSETSDEWVDVDNSGDEEILIYRERERPKSRSNSSGWCQKVRRQWSKSADRSSVDGSDVESTNHQYESVQGRNAQPVCDDFDGSYDSDSSFEDEKKVEEAHVNRSLPSVPQNDGIYGFMKEAGKRMRKHWSIGKSLRRIRKMSGNNLVPSLNNQDQSSSSTNSNGTSLNRRRWSSFKSKFRTSSVSVSSGSTFYLDSDQSSVHNRDLPGNSVENCDKQSTVTSSTTNSSQGSVSVDPRRFSVSSMRPTSPPPPPPPMMQKSVAGNNDDIPPKRPSRSPASTTSWYSEGETFDTSNGSYSESSVHAGSNSTWYSDSGLWDNSVPPDTASEHSSSQGSDLHLRFADEPLYQFYAATVTEEEFLSYSVIDDNGRRDGGDSDGYEEIGDLLPTRPSAMELVTPKQGHHRTLWCEIPQVRNCEILRTLTKEERKLQEAKFEVMTSEASYFKSLTVLEKHFSASPLLQDETVISAKDKRSLFGYVPSVRRCSEKLLNALDKCWQESIMLSGICDILHQHANQHFQVYASYCSNQIDLNSTLRRLRDTNRKFEEALATIEADPKCESLSLHSFLMLPMQRITRMPLLVDAILTNLDISHPEYSSCQQALKTLNGFVLRCNEETRQQERVIEMVKLSRQLDFSRDVRTLPIVSKNRWLVRSGQVLHLSSETRQTFGRKFTKQGVKLTLFLFNDVLLLARKRSEESYMVIDHCQKNLIQMNEEEDVLSNSNRYIIKLAMLKNHEGKLVEMILSCDSETSRQRWLQAVVPPTSEVPGESIYESWDCPQVAAVHSYCGQQPDELSLQQGDIIDVLRKMNDGWYYGDRTRDGEKGWFPGNHVHEIVSSHVRAKNLRQRYRLLSLSGSYLQQNQPPRKLPR